MIYFSPLRYPGGKRKLANYIRLLFHQNGLLDSEYAEPYAGGASIALSLLYGEYVTRIHLNDIDSSVATFWKEAINSSDNLCKRIQDTAVTIKEWERQKAVQSALNPDPLDLAFSTFFLNRTNRSGILMGGVIGGREQDGEWKIDARYNKKELISRIEKIARFKSRIQLYQMDATKFIQEILPSLPNESLVFLDPPYCVKGEGLYKHYYDYEDHKAIAALVAKIEQHWIVSYDFVPVVEELYRSYAREIYNISYSAQSRYKGTEVMFYSPSLVTPAVSDPTVVSNRQVNAQLGFDI